jgi:hypothetical protein
MRTEVLHKWAIVSAFLLAASAPVVGRAQSFAGTWNFDASKSKNVGAFFESGEMRYKMTITPEENSKMVIEDYTKTEAGWKTWKLNVDLNGPETTSTHPRGDLARFSFEAVAIGPDQTIKTKAVQGGDKSAFDLTSYFIVLVSQGTYNIVLHSHYELSADGKTLTVTETRNSRQEDEPSVYVFSREE